MSERASRAIRVDNDLGIHLRVAGALAQLASRFQAEIWLEHGTVRANAKSIMSVLALAAGRGVELVVFAEGEDAPQALQAVCDLIGGGAS